MNRYPDILYINYERTASGATVHRDELVKAARKLGARLTTLFHPSCVSQIADKTEAASEGIKENMLQYLRRKFYENWTEPALLLMTLKEGPRELRAITLANPRVIMANYTIHFSSVLIARALGIPIVLQIHTPYHIVQNDCTSKPFRLNRFWKWLDNRAVRMASGVVVVSQEVADYYVRQGFPRDKFVVTANGVDPAQFNPGVSDAGIRARYGLDKAFVIGYLGILDEWTGIDRLLELLRESRSLPENLRVLIVGSGPIEAGLRRIASHPNLQGRVVFTGFIPHAQVPEHIAAFDIAVAPYKGIDRSYISSMKLLEYMAMGKPVLTPRMRHGTELIRHGEDGFLYEADNERQMLEYLNLMLTDAELRKKLSEGALARSRETTWTWKSNAASVLDLCARVAAQCRSVKNQVA